MRSLYILMGRSPKVRLDLLQSIRSIFVTAFDLSPCPDRLEAVMTIAWPINWPEEQEDFYPRRHGPIILRSISRTEHVHNKLRRWISSPVRCLRGSTKISPPAWFWPRDFQLALMPVNLIEHAESICFPDFFVQVPTWFARNPVIPLMIACY